MQQSIAEFLLQNGRSLFLLIVSGTIGYCVYLLIQELQRQQPDRRTAIPIRTAASRRYVQRNTHPLRGRLVKLLHGDQQAAQRLIASSQARFPDKPDQWHYEKAIYDLSRDRH